VQESVVPGFIPNLLLSPIPFIKEIQKYVYYYPLMSCLSKASYGSFLAMDVRYSKVISECLVF
jgi:hypothetical protein